MSSRDGHSPHLSTPCVPNTQSAVARLDRPLPVTAAGSQHRTAADSLTRRQASNSRDARTLAGPSPAASEPFAPLQASRQLAIAGRVERACVAVSAVVRLGEGSFAGWASSASVEQRRKQHRSSSSSSSHGAPGVCIALLCSTCCPTARAHAQLLRPTIHRYLARRKVASTHFFPLPRSPRQEPERRPP
jgi:hypothetical protein